MVSSESGLRNVQEQIVRACVASGRKPGDVTLVAVSKTHGPEAIVPLLQSGQRVFGENRVQEARDKWPVLKERFAGIELHLIGPLQTNKAADAVALFDVIQSVDREKLVATLAKEMKQQNRLPRLLVQVNTGQEPQKAGIAPALLANFLALARERYGIEFNGLMCIPPVGDDPRPHFQLLARLVREHGLEQLSMGMSADYEVAIVEGATLVRIGSAIFGARPAPTPPAAR